MAGANLQIKDQRTINKPLGSQRRHCLAEARTWDLN
jgi:hypothetical protein